MKKENIIQLLNGIQTKGFVHSALEGAEIIDAVNFMVNKRLVSRTEQGNFLLTENGLNFLNGTLKWQNLWGM